MALLATFDTQPPPNNTQPPDDTALLAEPAEVLARNGTGEAPEIPVAGLGDLVQVVRASGMFFPISAPRKSNGGCWVLFFLRLLFDQAGTRSVLHIGIVDVEFALPVGFVVAALIVNFADGVIRVLM